MIGKHDDKLLHDEANFFNLNKKKKIICQLLFCCYFKNASNDAMNVLDNCQITAEPFTKNETFLTVFGACDQVRL